MIRPLELPVLPQPGETPGSARGPVRFTPRALRALARFRRNFGAGSPVLQVEVERDPGSAARLPAGAVPGLALHLSFARGSTPPDPEVFEEKEVGPVRCTAGSRRLLRNRVIDFVDEGGVRGFLVRTRSEPSGSRVSAPPSAPSDDAPVEGSTPGTELESAITTALRDRVNPLVESHGGAVRLLRVRKDRVAEVEMYGGCQGCSSARGTLETLVARILRRAVPELSGVEDVTDHAAGENPFRSAAGRACA